MVVASIAIIIITEEFFKSNTMKELPCSSSTCLNLLKPIERK